VLAELLAALPEEDEDHKALSERRARPGHELVRERHVHAAAACYRDSDDVGEARDRSASDLNPVAHGRVIAGRCGIGFGAAHRTRRERRGALLTRWQAPAGPAAVQSQIAAESVIDPVRNAAVRVLRRVPFSP